MKEKIKFTIYITIFTVFMIGAMIGYKALLSNQKNFDKNNSKNKQKEKLPGFEIYVNESEKINIKSLIGKPMIINMWTSWCGYCAYEMEYFNEQYLEEKDNINFIMINVTGDRDTIENANKYINNYGYSFKPYYDLELDALKTLGVYSYPTTIFVDEDGYIDSVKIGMVTKEELKNKIKELK